MTLILKLNLDIVKMYHHTKNEGSMSSDSKVIARADTQTDRQTNAMKTLLLPEVIIYVVCRPRTSENLTATGSFRLIGLRSQ